MARYDHGGRQTAQGTQGGAGEVGVPVEEVGQQLRSRGARHRVLGHHGVAGHQDAALRQVQRAVARRVARRVHRHRVARDVENVVGKGVHRREAFDALEP